MRRLILLAACVAACLTAARAADGGDAILRKVRTRYRTITAMTAKVNEVMCSAATGTCRRFQGTAEMKRPSRLRLDITTPEKQLIVCDGKTLTMYLAKEKQAYCFDMAKTDQMLTMLNPLDGLLDGEVVRAESDEGAHRLTMAVPKFKEYFSEITLTVDARTLLITGIAATDAAGNNAEYEFTDIKTNAKVKDNRFTFTPPKGVTVMQK
jgi:outer membrane lipoprotein carrier protein